MAMQPNQGKPQPSSSKPGNTNPGQQRPQPPMNKPGQQPPMNKPGQQPQQRTGDRKK